MFKKRKQNLRQRRQRNSDSEEENSGANKTDTTEPQTTSAVGKTNIWDVNIETVSKPKEPKKEESTTATASKSTRVLSFAHEEEEETSEFKVKKSSRSERIARKLKKASRKEREAELALQKELEEQKRKQIYDYRPASPHSDVGRGSDYDSDSDTEAQDDGHRFRSVLDTGKIPDANMIHLARKRRQMARDAQDYIPVAETSKRSATKEKSRLIREENDDEDEDDVVPFSDVANTRERQRLRDEFMTAEHGSGDSDSDKDTWEAQQIKKAMNMPQVQPTAGAKHVMESYLPARADPNIIAQVYESVPQSAIAVPQPAPMLSTQAGDTTDDLCKRLNECLETMKSVNRAHEAEHRKIKDDLDENEKLIANSETTLPQMEKRYRFFQQMRGFVKDLILCHNEKLPAIEDMETRYLQLLKDRSSKILTRRQQDIKDQVAEYNPNKAKTPHQPQDSPRHRRGAEREARKGRRRRARESINIVGHYDGLSTDDEQTQSDLTRVDIERQKIHQERNQLYEDVLEEFSKVPKLAEQFEEWKFDHGESYKDAYIALCLPKLFSPLVRLELVDWNPLDSACPSLERHNWFLNIVQYGRTAEIDPEDLDLKIAPSIIEKYVVPRLTILAESVWDPLSKRETLLFVALVERLATDFLLNDESKNMQLLLKAVVARIQKCLEDDIFIPLYPRQVHENKFSPPAVFFSRQVWICIKLFRNTLMWHRVLAGTVLKQIACDSLLNRYIILGLSNCISNQFVQRCQMIADAVPQPWYAETSEDSTFDELDKFCRFLVNVALNLDRLNQASKSEQEQNENRQVIQVIKKLLVNMHAMDHAMDLAQNSATKLDK